MFAAYVPTTEPGTEPLSLSEAKAHLRVTADSEDALITDLIKSARMYCENTTRRPLISQEWEMYIDCFPPLLRVEKTPVVSIDKVSYIAEDTEDGSYTDLEEDTDYQTDLKSMFPRILPAYGKCWPDTRCVMNAVRVQFTVGYANASKVPGPIKQAMKLLISSWFNNREAIVSGNGVTVAELPAPVGVRWILSGHRAWRF